MLNIAFENVNLDNLKVGSKYGKIRLYNTMGVQRVNTPGFKEVLFKILDSRFKYSIVVESVLIEEEKENSSYVLSDLIKSFYQETYKSRFTISEQLIVSCAELNSMLNKNFSFEVVTRDNKNYDIQEDYLIMYDRKLRVFDCKISTFENRDKPLISMYYTSNDKATIDNEIENLKSFNFELTHSCFNEDLEDEDILSKVKQAKINTKRIKELDELIYKTKPTGSFLYKLHEKMINSPIFVKEES